MAEFESYRANLEVADLTPTAGYVGVTDVDALHAHCVSRNADIVTPLTEHPWGLRDFVLRIPGGHRLAFGQRIGPAE